MQALRKVFASYFQVSRKPAADVVVLAFAAVAKSNMLCMADNLNAQDRCTFSTEVLLAQTMFQQLCEAAAFSANANPRSRSATPTPTPATRTHQRSISTIPTLPLMATRLCYLLSSQLEKPPKQHRNAYALGRHPVHWWKKFALNNEYVSYSVNSWLLRY